jgi:hypothetical protein
MSHRVRVGDQRVIIGISIALMRGADPAHSHNETQNY